MATADGEHTPVTLVVTEAQTVPTHTPTVHHPASPPPSHLPFTGFPLLAALLVTVLLLAVGSFLVLVGRRPTSRPRSA